MQSLNVFGEKKMVCSKFDRLLFPILDQPFRVVHLRKMRPWFSV